MSILSRYLDTSEARREAEGWERNHAQLIQQHADALGKLKRAEAENARLVGENRKLRGKVFALAAAADGDLRRILDSQAYERDRAEKALVEVDVLKADLAAAVTARQVAERAVDATRIPPAVDRQEAQDRANLYAKEDINAQLRRLAEDLEARVAELEAELRATLDKHERATP